MADAKRCPSCGENNPAEFEFCQYCQSRLQPLTGNLRGENAPVTPGQSPTKKTTSDLEPILPQWLRDARASARDAGTGELPQPGKPKTASPQTPSATPQDFLAGLRAQASQSEEEENADWLANLTGGAPAASQPEEESGGARWLNLGGEKESAALAEQDLPAWLQGGASFEASASGDSDLSNWMPDQNSQPAAPQATSFGGGDTDTAAWLRSLDGESAPAQPAAETPDWLSSLGGAEPAPAQPAAETPDWLSSLGGAESTPAQPAAETPDWLSSLGGAESTPAQPAAETPDWLSSLGGAESTPAQPAAETPDWLSSLGGSESAPAQPAAETPDWLSSLGGAESAPAQPAAETPGWLSSLGGAESAPAQPAAETPDWLSSLGGAEPAPAQPAAETPDWLSSLGGAESTPAQPAAETPDWLSSLGGAESTPAQPAAETPDWLSSLGGAESTPAQPAAETPDWLSSLGGAESAPAQPAAETPDWLSSLGGAESAPAQPAAEKLSEVDMPAWLAESPAPTTSSEENVPDWLQAAAPTPMIAAAKDEPAPSLLAAQETDSLFTEMPEWLSAEAAPAAENAPTQDVPAEEGAAIESGQLPTWVQALRPVDTGMSQIAAAAAENQPVESRGALAGLMGVLPAAPNYAPSSKPKAYSIKLHATDEHLSQAALLEQIISAETAPVPIASFSTLKPSPALRGSLSALFFILMLLLLALRTQIFSLPVGIPAELNGAIQVVQSIPANAPVLVAFDYDPARAAEMEAAAAPALDQMALLHSPRFTFISTNENGALLSERFILTGPLAAHHANGLAYLNLGYLPGGDLGIRAFSQNPRAAAPLDVNSAPAWENSPQVKDARALSDFAALVVITDNADIARAWVEQSAAARGSTPMIVISSAQSAPMIYPYYASGQVSGLVSGLHGAAIFEQQNAGRPGTARLYWDAYSVGMLLAAALIIFGALWNIFTAATRQAKR